MGFYIKSAGFNAWRRPTLPGLEPQYHWRSLVSRPSSGWDRVGHRRYGHQAMERALLGFQSMVSGVVLLPCMFAAADVLQG